MRRLDNENRVARQTFTIAYRDQAFYTWFQQDRPALTKLHRMLKPDEHGRVPESQLLHWWMEQDSWQERADELEEKAIVVMDQNAIQQRVEMMKNHAAMGKEMSTKGREYLKEHNLDSATEAIRAVTEGIRIERENTGYEAFFVKIATADDDTLRKELEKFMEKGPGGEVIIDAELKDANQDEPQP